MPREFLPLGVANGKQLQSSGRGKFKDYPQKSSASCTTNSRARGIASCVATRSISYLRDARTENRNVCVCVYVLGKKKEKYTYCIYMCVNGKNEPWAWACLATMPRRDADQSSSEYFVRMSWCIINIPRKHVITDARNFFFFFIILPAGYNTLMRVLIMQYRSLISTTSCA